MNQDLRVLMEQALQRQYVACMFDMDGTLVERGYHMPVPDTMSQALQEASRKAYMAICTTRPFRDAIKHAKELFGPRFEDFKDRWTWFCESGGAGYRYDAASDTYQEFYRVPWPQKPMSRAYFEELVRETFKDFVEEISFHPCAIIMRPKNYPVLDNQEIEDQCLMMERKGLQLLKDHGLEDVIRLGNSSLGVFFFNPDGDKNRGTLEFAKLLQSQGIKLSDQYREIILFGDKPAGYGNDHHFLNGKLGTPVSVGDFIPDRQDLLSVINERNERLTGPTATAYMLGRLHFRNL